MAITKIHAIKSTLGKALAYIENPDKTDGQMKSLRKALKSPVYQ